MMSSKFSHSRSSRGTFSSLLAYSLYDEKAACASNNASLADISSLDSPEKSETDGRHDEGKDLCEAKGHARRKWKLERLTLFLASSLTSDPDKSPPSSQDVDRGRRRESSPNAVATVRLLSTGAGNTAPPMPSQVAPPMPDLQPPDESPVLRMPESLQGQSPQLPMLTVSETSMLQKRRGTARSISSDQHVASLGNKLQSKRFSQRIASPSPEPRGRRSISAHLPITRHSNFDATRAASSPVDLGSPVDGPSSRAASPARGRIRKSRMPDLSRLIPSNKSSGDAVEAWILAPDSTADYSTGALVGGVKVSELWNEAGNVLIHLFPNESGRGPSFKVADHIFASSNVLTELMLADISARSNEGRGSLSSLQDPQSDGTVEYHLYLRLNATDLDHLVAVRNLFSFLTGLPLVGTNNHGTIFAALVQIAALLRKFAFTNFDGSSYGESVDNSFEYYINQFDLADVRHSREKTLEALILGELMKSWTLYNEAFCHAVGKYDTLVAVNSSLYHSVSASTRNRLERAHLALVNRQANVNGRLEMFEFPSLFAGIASSNSHEEYKHVRFREWRNWFGKMRNFVLTYYRDQYGSWPPKARSKRNQFSVSGLNRVCLKMLYADLCALYDLLVDRKLLTPRVIDQSPDEISEDAVDPRISALRKILSEFDHSSPPVLPPVPFDVPEMQTMRSIRENYKDLSIKNQLKLDKSIKPNELALMLIKSHNLDTEQVKMPFLAAFKDFERKEAKGMLPNEIVDQRFGYWLFLYVVIQSLPMLVVDAPDLQFTEGVEYFLCEPPQGKPPWVEDAGEVRKMWFQTAGQGIVELSADVVMYSVEATYMRSHCWIVAKEWMRQLRPEDGISSLEQPANLDLDDLDLPRPGFYDSEAGMQRRPASSVGSSGSPVRMPRSPGPRVNARASQAYRFSISIGLEPLASGEGGLGVPGEGSLGVPGDRSSRAVSASSLGCGSENSAARSSHGRSHSNGPLPSGPPDEYAVGGGVGGLVPRISVLPGSTHTLDSGSVGGSTFDEILKGMDKDKGKRPKKMFRF